MAKRIFSGILVSLLLISILALAFSIQPVRAIGTITINADGSISPSTAPISTVNNITYMFTGNINSPTYSGITVDRSNIVIDGNGYMMGNVSRMSTGGLVVNSQSNVTIKNINIELLTEGIYLNDSSNNTIYANDVHGSFPSSPWDIELSNSSGNTVYGNNATGGLYSISLDTSSSNNIVSENNAAAALYDIGLSSSSNNTVSGNTATARYANGFSLLGYGIKLTSSSNNTVSGNNATDYWGISLSSSSNNTVSGNNATANAVDGIQLYSSSNNLISGNNVTANRQYGISLYSSSSNGIIGNAFTGNGLDVSDSYQNSVENNTVNGKPLVYLEGVTNYSVGDAGQVVLVRCNNIGVEDLNLSYASVGVELSETNDSTISSNSIINCEGGISLESSYRNNIGGNNIANNFEGLSLLSSSSNSIIGNAFTGNGLDVSDSYQNSVENNTVNGKPLVYLEGVTNYSVGDAGQVVLVRCNNIGVEDLNLSYASVGVELSETNDSVISSNKMAGNNEGIRLGSSWNNSINVNIITENSYGVWLSGSSSGNSIDGNNITNNNNGIYITDFSSNNIFYHNNFINNPSQVSYFAQLNAWDRGYPSGGNYWSNYAGSDAFSGPFQNITGSDGIGDTPFLIIGVVLTNNTDHYPLMNPYSPSSLSVAKTVVVQGMTLDLRFAGPNYDNYPQSFNFTVYANTTSIASQNVTLPSLNSSITFTWNTTGVAFGNYNLWVSAADENCTGVNVAVTIPGDINGDFKVNLVDLVGLAQAYGSKAGDSNWNPNADIDGNGAVGLSDLVILAQHYGQHYP